MASNQPGPCCTRGSKHEGSPAGQHLVIGNEVTAYLVHPSTPTRPELAIVVLSDILGVLHNIQLIADQYAARGYLTIVPDLFNGAAVGFAEAASPNFDLQSFLATHNPSAVDPILETAIRFLRQEFGIKRIGAAGYCFGAKYTSRFLSPGKIDVGYIAHPSFITRNELRSVNGPLAIVAAEIDEIFTAELRHESETILGGLAIPWQLTLISGVEHGFAIRADLSKDNQRLAKEKAFDLAIEWFGHHLKEG